MANHNRNERLPGEVLAPADIRALLRACNQGPTGARNRALLVVLWRGGLRIAEALALRPVDLDAAAGLVRVRRGKGGRPRQVGLDPEAFAAVDAWIGRRSALGIGGRAPSSANASPSKRGARPGPRESGAPYFRPPGPDAPFHTDATPTQG